VTRFVSTALRTLLVVEDEPLIRWVLGQAFRPRYDVIEAGTVRDGRLRFHERAAGGLVVILDLHLPDGSGTPLVAEFAAAPQRCPVVVLTSSADEDTRATVMALGATAFIPKPFVLSDVVICVDQVAGRAA
jgi:DNA-binding NtrC family response regulator